jgi:hypothetical protein
MQIKNKRISKSFCLILWLQSGNKIGTLTLQPELKQEKTTIAKRSK